MTRHDPVTLRPAQMPTQKKRKGKKRGTLQKIIKVKLKQGAEVNVVIEAEPGATIPFKDKGAVQRERRNV